MLLHITTLRPVALKSWYLVATCPFRSQSRNTALSSDPSSASEAAISHLEFAANESLVMGALPFRTIGALSRQSRSRVHSLAVPSAPMTVSRRLSGLKLADGTSKSAAV